MELGVDIAELNVVNMRNVPPTPANYAQRSGRAGRGGQPALVFTYCAGRSPHDQYFFKRPDRMVAGAVALPRIDLANEDLLRAHVQAVWLSETGADLRTALSEILDVNGDQPTLSLRCDLVAQLTIPGAVERARQRGQALLADLAPRLEAAAWYSADWLDRVLAQALETLDRCCDRWRDLYRAARRQMEEQNKTMLDASRSQPDRNQAARLHAEARSQLNLLLKTDDVVHSDFYSYRYFASEGFLPGYNFPRLPLSAFIPGRRVQDEFLSRARFLAISEFGPRSIVYHEGSKYRVNRVILPPGEDPQTRQVKLCPSCGYLHPVGLEDQHDVCEECGVELDLPLERLLRMQNVSTRRQDRIHSDEEERLRLGFEVVTGVRWPRRDGRPSMLSGVLEDSAPLATLKFAQAAELWRINLGWTRRKQAGLHGFLLDLERGYWSSNEQDETDKDDPKSPRLERVIPFVSDTRNSLVLTPEDPLDAGQMASLLAALKTAIQVAFQLEGAELAAELLPRSTAPRSLLLYEAAEGGAGVLQRLLDNPDGLAQVARKALELCHFDPENGDDLGRAPGAEEDCEAACYDCLLSYSNQRDHAILDRKAIRDLLLAWSHARVTSTPGSRSRSAHLADLVAKTDSELERKWLRFLDEGGYHLPSDAQTFVNACKTRPDFVYGDRHAVVYIDGPVHLQPQKKAVDALQQECLEDHGFTVIRFCDQHMERAADGGDTTDWAETVRRHEGVFGPGRREVEPAGTELDPDLYDEWLVPGLLKLAARGYEALPGGDVMAGGRVIGSYLAEIVRGGKRLRLLNGQAADLQALQEELTRQGFAFLAVTADTIDPLLDQEELWP
jgi:very-short-patch-repair endonuclease